MTRRPLYISLILLLLAMQAATLAHGIEHALDGEHAECASCILAQNFKHCPPSNPTPFTAQYGHELVSPAEVPIVFSTVAKSFHSRAPPRLPVRTTIH